MTTHFPLIVSTFRQAAIFVMAAGLFGLVTSGVVAQNSSISSTIVEDTTAANPKDPTAILRAVDNLLNVGEFDLANEFLQKFLASNPSQKQLSRVHSELGSAFFARLVRLPEVTELGSQVTELVMGATEAENRDPKVINRLIDIAIGKNEDGRRSARSRLKTIGPHAVPYLLQRFTDGSLENDQPIKLRHTLATVGNAGTPAFVGALTSGDVALTAEAANALGSFEASAAVLYLFRPYFARYPQFDFESNQVIRQHAQQAIFRNLKGLPSRDDAAKILKREIDRLLNDQLAVTGDLDGTVGIWLWDPTEQTLSERRFDRTSGIWLTATILADDLFRIQPDVPAHRELFVTTQLGWAKLRSGIGIPIPESTIQSMIRRNSLDPHEVNLALANALEKNKIPSAVAAAEILGHMEKYIATNQTVGINSNAKALNVAAKHPHPRIRAAAAEAILRLSPTNPYEGACDVAKSLMQMATGSLDRNVLIIHPKQKQATFLAGALQTLGLNATIATTGKEGLRASRADADIELILISDTVTKPSVSDVVQQIDHDHLTKPIPVCLMTTSELIGAGAEIVQRFPQMETFPLPSTTDGVAKLVQHTLPLTDEFALTPDERLARSQWAILKMGELATDPVRFGFYEPTEWTETLVAALENPNLSSAAANALGQIGTPDAQLALVSHAAEKNFSIASRSAAARAFETAVERRGIMLNSKEILQQYDHYNDNLDDENTAEILSTIIDSIERPSQK